MAVEPGGGCGDESMDDHGETDKATCGDVGEDGCGNGMEDSGGKGGENTHGDMGKYIHKGVEDSVGRRRGASIPVWSGGGTLGRREGHSW